MTILACVMNIVSFENAYSLYPKETFETRRSLVCVSAGPRQETARQKYANRGWELFTSVSDEEKKSLRSSLRQGNRWVGDRNCWTLPLGCEGVDLSSCITPRTDCPVHDYLALHTWQLRYAPAPQIDFNIFRSPVLKTNYTACDKELFDFLYPKIKKTSIQLRREGPILRRRFSDREL
jgi:hypothetical protein